MLEYPHAGQHQKETQKILDEIWIPSPITGDLASPTNCAALPNRCESITSRAIPLPQQSLFPPQDLFDTEVIQNSYQQSQPKNNAGFFSSDVVPASAKPDTSPVVEEANVPNLDYHKTIFDASSGKGNTQSQLECYTQPDFYQYPPPPPRYNKSNQLRYNQNHYTPPGYNQSIQPECNQYIPPGYTRSSQPIRDAIYNRSSLPDLPYNDFQENDMNMNSYSTLPIPNPQYQYRPPTFEQFITAQSVSPFTAMNTTNNMITITNVNAPRDVYMNANSESATTQELTYPERHAALSYNNYDRTLNQWTPYPTPTRGHPRPDFSQLHSSRTTLEDSHEDRAPSRYHIKQQEQELLQLRRNFLRQTPISTKRTKVDPTNNRSNLTQVFNKAPYKSMTPQPNSSFSSMYTSQNTSNFSLRPFPTSPNLGYENSLSRVKTATGGTQSSTSPYRPTTPKSSKDPHQNSLSSMYATQNTKSISLQSFPMSPISSYHKPLSGNNTIAPFIIDDRVPSSHTQRTTVDPMTSGRCPSFTKTEVKPTYQLNTSKSRKDPVLSSVSSMYATEGTFQSNNSLHPVPKPTISEYDKPLSLTAITPFSFDDETDLVIDVNDYAEGLPMDLIELVDLSDLDQILDLPKGN